MDSIRQLHAATYILLLFKSCKSDVISGWSVKPLLQQCFSPRERPCQPSCHNSFLLQPSATLIPLFPLIFHFFKSSSYSNYSPFDETALLPWHLFTPAPQGLPAIYVPLPPIFSISLFSFSFSFLFSLSLFFIFLFPLHPPS
jgi:hypothetical protein